MNKVPFAILLLALVLASCSRRQSASDCFQRRFNISLPNGAKCSEYHTTFENENDWVYAVEFQDVAQSRVFRSKWGLTKGMSGQGEIFKQLKGVIAGTEFEKELLRKGWSIVPQSYDAYEGKTKGGRDSNAFLSVDERRMLVVVFGGITH